MKLFLLYYDTDSGNREDWSVFYTPCEIFESDVLRQARINALKVENCELEFHTDEKILNQIVDENSADF